MSLTGYQEDDIDVRDPATFQLVIGDTVLDENGIEKKDHKYVFAPEGKEDFLVHFTNKSLFFLQLYRRESTRPVTLRS